MTGKKAIIEFFKRKDIKQIFHIPGIHTLPLNESLVKQNITVFVGRHESNLIFMADGYARTSGKPGVVVVTPGPGLGNVTTGCMEAYNDDVPLVIIHVDTDRKDVGKGILHELVEPEYIFRHFTKRTLRVVRENDLLSSLNEAWDIASSPRKGPVLISIPYTFLEKQIPCPAPASVLPEIQNPERSTPNEILAASPFSRGEICEDSECQVLENNLQKALNGKRRPLIIGGKSLMIEEARSVLDGICKDTSIPFLTTTGGKGTVREDNSYTFGNIMQKGVVKDIIASSDIVVALGTRLLDVDARRRGVKLGELIHADIDNHWIGKNYTTKLSCAGDIRQVLKSLRHVLKGRKFDWPLTELKPLQIREQEAMEKTAPGLRIVKVIRQIIPEDAITVWDLNLISYWAEYYFPVFEQHTFIMPRGISPIFYALPASLGAKIGRPERPCLAICGDGGALPAIGELSTLKKYGIPVVLLVYNNNSFGILDDYMVRRYGIEDSMRLDNPDFARLAHSFGIKAKKVKTLESLKEVFLHRITWDESFLIEFNYPVFPLPWSY